MNVLTAATREAMRHALAAHFAVCGWEPVATAQRLDVNPAALKMRAHRLGLRWASARRAARCGDAPEDVLAIGLNQPPRLTVSSPVVWIVSRLRGVYRIYGVRDLDWLRDEARRPDMIGMYRQYETAAAVLAAIRHPRDVARRAC